MSALKLNLKALHSEDEHQAHNKTEDKSSTDVSKDIPLEKQLVSQDISKENEVENYRIPESKENMEASLQTETLDQITKIEEKIPEDISQEEPSLNREKIEAVPSITKLDEQVIKNEEERSIEALQEKFSKNEEEIDTSESWKNKKFRLSAFSLSWSQKKEETPELQEDDSQKNQQDKITKRREDIKFKNYESSFEKEKNKIFEKIRNFKYAPKTRIGFIISLMGVTFWTLWFLMILNPEKNSLEVYKASLMDIYQWRSTRLEVDLENDEKDPRENWEESNQKQELLEEKEEAEKREVKKERLRQHLLEKYTS